MGFEKVDLVGVNFSDFVIIYSINSEMCDKLNISGYSI